MNKLVFFLCSYLCLIMPAFAIEECGDHEVEDRSLNWVEITKVNVYAKIQTIRGILCAGLLAHDDRGIDSVVYRDNAGSLRVYKIAELTTKPQVLVTHEDLDIGLIKEGPIMTLLVDSLEAGVDYANYNLKLRFLRNLNKFDFSDPDYKELDFSIKNNYQNNDVFPYYNNDLNKDFNNFNIYISIALNIHQIVLKDLQVLKEKIKTSRLRSVPTY